MLNNETHTIRVLTTFIVHHSTSFRMKIKDFVISLLKSARTTHHLDVSV